MMDNIDLTTCRSFYFEVRNGQLIEIPTIEYIYNFNKYIKSLIKHKVDPRNEFEELRIKVFQAHGDETIYLSEANLQQSIQIATCLQISENELLGNPNSITLEAITGDSYMFDVSVLDQLNTNIIHAFGKLIVEAYELTPNDITHLFIPTWLNSKLADSVLEIMVDKNYGPSVTIIPPYHPRRREIEERYSK